LITKIKLKQIITIILYFNKKSNLKSIATSNGVGLSFGHHFERCKLMCNIKFVINVNHCIRKLRLSELSESKVQYLIRKMSNFFDNFMTFQFHPFQFRADIPIYLNQFGRCDCKKKKQSKNKKVEEQNINLKKKNNHPIMNIFYSI